MSDTVDSSIKTKLDTMQNQGLAVVMTANQMDLLEKHCELAGLPWPRSAMNDRRIGLLDVFVVWFAENALNTPKNIAPLTFKFPFAYTHIIEQEESVNV